tara:strand:- start:4060 stop:4776 length:717 start_codon:yes stop_codon:yes gene_type:complete
MLSILIPLRDEVENLPHILRNFEENIKEINYEVIFVNDFSKDDTFIEAKKLSDRHKNYLVFDNKKKGLGGAINLGISHAKGDYICIVMADLSDDVNDIKKYYNLINSNKIDAVFGSRFLNSSKIKDYPINKLILNRIFNFIVKILFLSRYNDFTNAFKIYRSEVLKSFLPLISESFNIFLEMPLKIISRGYKYEIIPINWYNRKKGKNKFDIKELRSKYLFTLIHCFTEKILLKKRRN